MLQQSSLTCLAFRVFFTLCSVWSAGCVRQDEVIKRQTADDRVIDIGVNWVGTDCSHPIEIENTTSKSLRVLSFKTSCRCASVSPESLVIPPHETAEVRAEIDTSIPSNELSLEISLSILPVLDDGTILPRTHLVGKTINPVSVPKSWFDLGELRLGKSGFSHRTFVTELQAHEACDSLEMSFDDKKLTCRLIQDPAFPKRYKLSVSPVSDLSAGAYCEALQLICKCNDEYPPCPSREVFFSWHVLPRTIVLPQTLALGVLSSTDETSGTGVFKNGDGGALRVFAQPLAVKGVYVSKVPHENAFRVRLDGRELDPSAHRIDLRFEASIGTDNVKEQLVVPVLFQVPSLPDRPDSANPDPV